MPFQVGPLELVVVLAVALIVLGPKKLPEVGRSLGKGMREFRSSLSGEHEEQRDEEKAPEPKAPLPK
ncbi:MAG TPA: twin-arginine translocase TatA/TatE family subunit [Solirubrobacteraceae bacterium]|jgi:sec-independent protein translocase protein TatA|nr:twin-arginine translocase TatA/TatE family subunit [Solirubrobacteraceae bacterium]